MTSPMLFRASLVSLGVTAALASQPIWAQADQTATEDELAVITVTGSRTITDVLRRRARDDHAE
jgi:hypothetical protein